MKKNYFKCSEIRKDIINIISASGAAHVASSLSCVEILTAIYENVDIKKIKNNKKDRDKVILSKGHATASLYATLKQFSLMTNKDLLTYSKENTYLAGHPNHLIKHVEHSTGALGHGLPVGVGMCLASRSLGFKNKVYIVLGDGELHEGSNWEAMMFAGHHKLNNLRIFVDNNGQSQIGETDNACSLKSLTKKISAFNFKVIMVDGNSFFDLDKKIKQNINSTKPTAFICNTIKGKGVSFMEKNNLWHYKTPRGEELKKSLEEIKI